jgi:hypothetical protein
VYIYTYSEDIRLLVKSKPLLQRREVVVRVGGGSVELELDTSEGNVFIVDPAAAPEGTQ